MTFSAFITAVYRDVLNKNSNTLTVLKEITVRQLKELSLRRTLFMEASGTFPTVAEKESYAPGQGGLPADIFSIDQLYWTSGNHRYEIRGPVAVEELRLVFSSTSPTQYPSAWGWQSQELVLAPPPAGVVTLGMDFLRDATRDSDSGLPITVDSTDETNPWFDRGELALRNAVLAEYFKMPAWRDQEAAAFASLERDKALQTLRGERVALKFRGGQAPACWSDDERSYAWL